MMSMSFNENKWVLTIRQVLEEEQEEIEVPKPLMLIKPHTYTPQQVSIGPYHLRRAELYEMRRYKLHAAQRTQKLLQGNLKFQDVVDHFAKQEIKIRASYQKFLDLNPETLAWIMALDASFILEFLQIIAAKHGTVQVLTRVSSRIKSHHIHCAGNISTHNAVLRDIMMLENQIPLFVLRELLGFSMQKPDEPLAVLLKFLYREVSPFKNLSNFPPIEEISKRNHILEILYYMMVPNQIGSFEDQENQANKQTFVYLSFPRKIFNSISTSPPFRSLGPVLTWENFKTVVDVTWRLASNAVPSSKKKPLETIITSVEIVVDEFGSEDGSSHSQSSELPLVEELQIPSVSDLSKVGVKFHATMGGLRSIKFDKISLAFHLPIITLDENSEVILRNLVAFEACAIDEPLIFTRYTELMNGIINSEEDVTLLRKQGVIVNHLRSDGEVADLWNSMSKSVKLTKVDFLDKVIEDVNKYYNAKWKVRTGKLLKKYVYAFWPLLTFLAAILVVLSTCLQAFCSIYSCSGALKVNE